MTGPVNSQPTSKRAESPLCDIGSSPAQTSIVRKVFVLAIAALLLVGFIAVLADVRHRQQATDQATWHAGVLAERMGETRTLPLNLNPMDSPERRSGIFAIEATSTKSAIALRKRAERIIVSQTVPQRMRLLPNGRGVVFFENGAFDVKWMTLEEFDRALAAQQARIQGLAPP